MIKSNSLRKAYQYGGMHLLNDELIVCIKVGWAVTKKIHSSGIIFAFGSKYEFAFNI